MTTTSLNPEVLYYQIRKKNRQIKAWKRQLEDMDNKYIIKALKKDISSAERELKEKTKELHKILNNK